MESIKVIIRFMGGMSALILALCKIRLISDKDKEILALRSQLALFHQQSASGKIKTPRATLTFRMAWVFLSRHFKDWKDVLIIVKPETVIKWHRKGFKLYWSCKSKKRGRPAISMKTIALIKRIHKENPFLSAEKIHEKLKLLNIADTPSPTTISKYIKDIRRPSTEKQRQSWRTFLKNHRSQLWAIDFFTASTINFKILYVVIIINHARREIEHFAVTENPTAAWTVQQIRNATAFSESPKYIIHDNDPAFTSDDFQKFLKNSNIESVRTGIRAPWQNGICERAIKTIRCELLTHIIPINVWHLHRLLSEYTNKYYNPHRTHQAIDCQTPIASTIPTMTMVKDTKLKSVPILNGLFHSYQKVA